jgi:hypothetical protein
VQIAGWERLRVEVSARVVQRIKSFVHAAVSFGENASSQRVASEIEALPQRRETTFEMAECLEVLRRSLNVVSSGFACKFPFVDGSFSATHKDKRKRCTLVWHVVVENATKNELAHPTASPRELRR